MSADRGGPKSLLPTAVLPDECIMGMQFRSRDLGTDITHFSRRPAPLPASHHEQPRLLDLGDSVHKSAYSALSPQLSRWSQPLPIGLLKLWRPPPNIDAHPNTQLTTPFAVDWSFVIASSICFSAFLLYSFPSLLYIFSFCKY